MLDAAELIELAVFERHCTDLECKYQKQDILYRHQSVILDYFKTRINDLKERSRDN